MSTVFGKPDVNIPEDYRSYGDKQKLTTMRVQADMLNKAINPNNQQYKTAQFSTDGNIMTFTRDFEQRYKSLIGKDPDQLYDRIITDISTIPVINDLKYMLNDIFETRFKANMNAVYTHAASSFRMLMEDSMLFEFYQLRFYLFIMIDYIYNNQQRLKHLQYIDKYIEWIRPRVDPNIEYFITGPKENTVFDVTTSVDHYQALINPTVNVADLTNYLQLTAQQNISDQIQQIHESMLDQPNAFTKLANEQCKFLLSIDSSENVIVNVDDKNNLVFNCENVSIGDLKDTANTARISEIKIQTEPMSEPSTIAIRTIRDLFNSYGRIKIINLTFTKNAYISSLTSFKQVFVIFEGVSCDERAVYSNANMPYLKIGGHFKETQRGYEFVPDVDAITYKPARVDVKHFKVYITSNPGGQNSIIPNPYTLKANKSNLFQHPFRTNIQINEEPETRIELYRYKDGILSNDKNDPNVFIQTPINNLEELIRDINNIINANPFAATPSTTLANAGLTMKKTLMALQTHFESIEAALLVAADGLPSEALLSHIFKATTAYFAQATAETKAVIAAKQIPDVYEQKYSTYSLEIGRSVVEYLVRARAMSFNLSEITLRDDKDDTTVAYKDISDDGVKYVYTIAHRFLDTECQIHLLNVAGDHIKAIAEKEYTTANELLKHCVALMFNLSFTNSSNILTYFDHLKCFVETLRATVLLFNNGSKGYIVEEKVVDKIVKIDQVRGTIEGKYFRFIDGKPVFADVDGKPFETPDPDYVIYDERENDLTLFNMYKYGGNNDIQQIANSSFLYSNNLNTIQNLSYNLNITDKITQKISLDNKYITVNTLTDEHKVITKNDWEDVGRAINKFPYLYLKVVKNINGEETAEYIAKNMLNNTLTLNLEATSVVYLMDGEKFVRDLLIEPISDAERDDSKYSVMLIEELFDRCGKQLSEGSVKELIDVNGVATSADVLTTVYYATGNEDVFNTFYYKYFNKASTVVFENDNMSCTGTVENPDEYNYDNLILNTNTNNVSIDINGEVDSAHPLNTTVKNFLSTVAGANTQGDFEGYVRPSMYGAIIYNMFNGVVHDPESGAVYLLSALCEGSKPMHNSYSVVETLNGKRREVIFSDSFNNTITLSDTISTSMLEEGEPIANLHGKTFSTTGSDANTTTVTYLIDEQGIIKVTTETRNALTADTLYHIVYIYYTSATHFYIAYQETANEVYIENGKTIVCAVPSGVYYDKDSIYFKDTFSTDVNEAKSNFTKAFTISTKTSLMSNYWNNDIYSYGAAHARLPINPNVVPVPQRINETVENDEFTDVYDSEGNKLNGKYVINTNGILSAAGAKKVDELYVFKHQRKTYNMLENVAEDVAYMNSPVELELYDSDMQHKFDIKLKFTNWDTKELAGFELYAIDRFYNKDNTTMTLYYNRKFIIASYDSPIVSNTPIYINNPLIRAKLIIDFETVDTGLAIHSVNLSEGIEELTYYMNSSSGCMQTILPHLQSSNVIGQVIQKQETLLNISLNKNGYRLFPCIVYAENIFIEPRYLNTNNNFITLLNTFNQNTQTTNAIIKSENTLSNDAQYNVANMINTNTNHIIESLDDYMLMISDMDKRENVKDIAIDKEDIFIIPHTSRMSIAIEFS